LSPFTNRRYLEKIAGCVRRSAWGVFEVPQFLFEFRTIRLCKSYAQSSLITWTSHILPKCSGTSLFKTAQFYQFLMGGVEIPIIGDKTPFHISPNEW